MKLIRGIGHSLSISHGGCHWNLIPRGTRACHHDTRPEDALTNIVSRCSWSFVLDLSNSLEDHLYTIITLSRE